MRISGRYRRPGKTWQKTPKCKYNRQKKTGNLSRNRAQDNDPSYGPIGSFSINDENGNDKAIN